MWIDTCSILSAFSLERGGRTAEELPPLLGSTKRAQDEEQYSSGITLVRQTRVIEGDTYGEVTLFINMPDISLLNFLAFPR